MGTDHAPFVVGQKVEAQSFMKGYRSSWFRCEIKEMKETDRRRDQQISALVDYYDYTEQKPSWLVLYQEPPYGKKSDRKKKLMLRPKYPVICHETPVTDVNTAEEVVLVVNGPWKVGDMVDWLGEGCYWSGRLTKILDANNAQIALIPLPMGEGGLYDVSLEDLRPSLEWSIESGWTVPISEDHEESCCCARLFYPMQQVYALKNVVHTGDDSTERSLDEGCCLDECIEEASAGKRTLEEEPDGSYQGTTSSEGIATLEDVVLGVAEILDKGTTSSEGIATLEDAVLGMEEISNEGTRSFEGIATLEDAVLGIEEISNKVKWLKRMLKSGLPLYESEGPSWEFLEHHGPRKLKRT